MATLTSVYSIEDLNLITVIFIHARREIIQFLDPKNPHWARYEAINLMSMADRNRDNRLDMEVKYKPCYLWSNTHTFFENLFRTSTKYKMSE